MEREEVGSVDVDEQAYANLEAELGPEEGQEEATPEPVEKEPEKPVEQAQKDKPADDKPPLPYEELSTRYSNLQGALAEERGQRKALKEQIDKMERAWEETQRRMMEREQPAYKIPSVDEDPIEHFKAVADVQFAELNELREWREQQETERQHYQQQQQFVQTYARAAQEYAQEQQDFPDAYNFLVSSRVQEYRLAGVPNPEQAAMQDEQNIVAWAFQQGENPAKRLYALAQARGYSAAPKQEPPKTTQAEQKIETLAKGQKEGSLGSNGSEYEGLSLKRLADLMDEDPEAADKYWEKAKKAGLLG